MSAGSLGNCLHRGMSGIERAHKIIVTFHVHRSATGMPGEAWSPRGFDVIDEGAAAPAENPVSAMRLRTSTG
jgi:hypothetical protein